jgi:hypothetical protein
MQILNYSQSAPPCVEAPQMRHTAFQQEKLSIGDKMTCTCPPVILKSMIRSQDDASIMIVYAMVYAGGHQN